ncbi:MAG: ribosomal RNA small subunit methyltransferase A [Clostridia bacterium]|nr:ribosomal RNA small subunit methyltransferase A [Clostridia bacterium]
MNRIKTRERLDRFGIKPNRRLGQNFLIDENIAADIAALCTAGTGDLVVEIGPGLGALTIRLAERAGRVLTVEIDRALIPALRETLQGVDNVTLVRADFMEFDLAEGIAAAVPELPGFRIHVAANVPYYITTPILRKLLICLPECSSMVFLLQKEAAARLTAPPGSGSYGPVAVCLEAFFNVRSAFRVPPHAFHPQPGVDSMVVQAVRKPAASLPEGLNPSDLLTLADAAFAHRRKRLYNSLAASGYLDERRIADWNRIEAALGMPDALRAEEMTAEDFVRLYHALEHSGDGR